MQYLITPAQRAVLDHLLDAEAAGRSMVPAAAAGHHPHASAAADLPIEWLDPVPVFAHPADPGRLLVGVGTSRGAILVALDHLAHTECVHTVCGAVVDERLRELPEIPADAALFAAFPVNTLWSASPVPYLVHIDDYQTLEEMGWTGILVEHAELAYSAQWAAGPPRASNSREQR